MRFGSNCKISTYLLIKQDMKKCKNIGCNNETKENRVYCSLTCRNIYTNKYLRDYSKVSATLSKDAEYYINPKKCLECNEIIKYECRRNSYCNHSCSASATNLGRTHSEETKKKMAIASSIDNKKRMLNPEYVKKFLVSTGKRRFNSKGEIEMREYFIKKFPEHEWSHGAFVFNATTNMLAADMYSHKLKICVEYDGIWHFKDIHGQLEKKKLKDKLLDEWCIENGYRMIRIKEEVYKKNKELALDRIKQEILFGKEPIIKFYEFLC